MTAKTLPQVTIGGNGTAKVEVSSVGLGCMGLSGTWDLQELTTAHYEKGFLALDAAVENGINFFDHADIYGSTSCEMVFGAYLKDHPGLRETIFIATKCGILFEDALGPQRYNLSADYIKQSLVKSLERLNVNYVDLYQVHRPDPYTHPKDTAAGLNQLVREGLIRYVGVSNHFVTQVSALQHYLDVPIVTTQPSFSLWDLEPLHNGVLDQCVEREIRPLAYSPLGGGYLVGRKVPEQSDPNYHRFQTLQAAFQTFGEKYGATSAQLSLAWLMQHPAGVIPLLGSNNPENIREAAQAHRVRLSREDWYSLWVAARGVRLP